MFLTRFLFYSNQASIQRREIKRQGLQALLVESKRRHEISVFNTLDLSLNDVIAIGNDHVGIKRKETVKYVVGFSESVVNSVLLSVENDKVGHDRHCNIINWPKNDEDRLEKEKELVQKINTSPDKIFWADKD